MTRTRIVLLGLALLGAFTSIAKAHTVRPLVAYSTCALMPAKDGVMGYGPPNVGVMRLDGTRPHELGPGEAPAISPDGRFVAAAEQGPHGGLITVVLYRSGGGEVMRWRLSASTIDRPGLSWSPDSRYIALTQNLNPNSGDATLRVFDTTTDEIVVRIGAVDHQHVTGASFAPTLPDRLVYAASLAAAPTRSHLFERTTDPNSWTTELPNTEDASTPVWGRRGIAFTDGKNDAHLWLTPSLARTLPGQEPIAFSSNGQFLLERSGVLDLSTGHITALPNGEEPPTPTALSRDGSKVLAIYSHSGPTFDSNSSAIVSATTGRSRDLPAAACLATSWDF